MTKPDFVAQFEAQPILPLPPASKFKGSGVYALYYAGSLYIYAHLGEAPIYVASASGRNTLALHRRLVRHCASLDDAYDFAVEEFSYRALILEPSQAAKAERILADHYQPVWNQKFVSGFALNRPGEKFATTRPTNWSIAHPGRSDAGTAGHSFEQRAIAHEQIQQYLQASVAR